MKSSKKRTHICLDKRFLCYIIVKIFVNCDVFFRNFNLKVGRSRFLIPISNEFKLALWIQHSGLDLKFQSSIIYSDTERLQMLIFLHICSFIMSYNSSDISLGDNGTVILYNLDLQSREMHCDLSLCKFCSIVAYTWWCWLDNQRNIIHLFQ